jgi:hypothetical protein
MASANKLNPKQEQFCQLYASDREFFGNGVESYIEVYEQTDPRRTGTRVRDRAA